MPGAFTHVPYVTDYMRVCLDIVREHFGGTLSQRKSLDLPAGNGWLSDEFRRLGAEATAADINEERTDYAQIDMERPLPFDSESFDVVVSAEGIEHVFNPAQLFSELSRVLRPGGLLIITTPNIQSLASRWQTLCCGYSYQFDPFNKVPLARGQIGDKGHISPVSYIQLHYYAQVHRLTVLPPRGGIIRERALKLLPFLPFLVWGLWWTYRDWKKTSTDKEQLSIRKNLFSWPVLHSRSLIFVCQKT